MSSLAAAAAVALLAAPGQADANPPRVISATVIDPYVVEVKFNERMLPHPTQPWEWVTVKANGRRYTNNLTIMRCKKTQRGGAPCVRDDQGCLNYRWLWIALAWPIYSGDTVTFSYSAPEGGRHQGRHRLGDAGGHPLRDVTNYAVTNNSTAGKPVLEIENIDTAVRAGAIFRYEIDSSANGTIWPGTTKEITGDAGEYDMGLEYSGPPASVDYFWRSDPFADTGHTGPGTDLTQKGRKSGDKWEARDYIPPRRAGNSPLFITVANGPGANAASSNTICIRIDDRDGTQGTAFDFQVEFSEAVSATAEQMRSAVGATGGTVTAAALAQGSDRVWELTVTPSGTGTVTLSLPPSATCTETGAICTSDGRKLSEAVAIEVVFAARLSVADAEATEGDDTTLDFTVTLAPAVSDTVTVQYATSNGTATAGEDCTATSGTLTFSSNETTKTVSVAIIDDTVEDDGETFTLTLSNPTVAVLADAEATGTIRNTEATAAALTASFQDVPESHDGESTFTFGLQFSEDVAGLSYTTLRDDAFTVTGGEVTNARRKTQGSNQSWEIEIEPAGNGATSITLAAGAVSTSDGRLLEAAVSASVAGPVGVSVADAEVDETAGAVLSFAVTLGRAAEVAMTVDYATSDGTAVAGSDYTAASGTLSFAPGESSKTIEVSEAARERGRVVTATTEPPSPPAGSPVVNAPWVERSSRLSCFRARGTTAEPCRRCGGRRQSAARWQRP